MFPLLENYDWKNVFTYGTPEPCKGSRENKWDKPHTHGGAEGVLGEENISTKSFDREDVKEIIGYVEGEADSEDWVMTGLLEDGRYFAIRAGCDYTGWD